MNEICLIILSTIICVLMFFVRLFVGSKMKKDIFTIILGYLLVIMLAMTIYY